MAEKDTGTYSRVLRRFGVEPRTFVMIGNAPASDVQPVLQLGGWAVHVPHELTWALEHHDEEEAFRHHPRYRLLDSLEGLSGVLDSLTD